MLAAIARLAGRGRMGEGPRASAGGAAQARRPRPVDLGGGFGQCPRRGRGGKTGPNPTDRRKPGSKHHVCTDAWGVPLSCTLSGANRPDGEFLIPLIDAIPKIKGKIGAPVFRPEAVVADKAYTWLRNKVALGIRGIEAWLPEKGTDEDRHLGVYRWVVERTIAWLHQFRRLRVRYERRDDIHEAFFTIGCIMICHRCLRASF